MLRLGAIIRTLMLAACVVPFTSTQQAAGALAPYVPSVPVSTGDAPTAPADEEDDERETEDGKEGDPSAPRHRLPVRERAAPLPLSPAFATHGEPGRHSAHARPTPPDPADPFRNGLGTPYRC